MHEYLSEFIAAVAHMRKTHENGTFYWMLGTDSDNNIWSIVLGWRDGFDKDEKDDCSDGTWHLCAKLAYQPHNSYMQCDYDVDWIMPYDEKTGEVDYTEIAIYPDTVLEEVFNWLLECYERYKDR